MNRSPNEFDSVMDLEGVTKRTEHHSYCMGIYLQEQRIVTRT